MLYAVRPVRQRPVGGAREWRHRIIAVLLTAWACAAALAQPFDDARAAGRAALRALVEEPEIPGLSVAVAVDGQIMWAEGFGLASLELGAPVTPETRFRIGSISKPITATAAVVLAQEGLLDLDEPIQTYLPDYPRPEPMTCRQLAGHTSGIRHYRGLEVRSAEPYPLLRAAFEIYAADPLLFEPGADRSYSTYAYTTFGAVMEAAAGEEFFAIVTSRVLGPLGMEDTVVDAATPVIAHRAAPYNPGPLGGVINAPFTDHSYKIPGGGMLSTPTDLVVLASALFEPGLLEREWLDELFEPVRTADGAEHPYAFGWSISRDGAGRPIFGHSGSQPGASAWLFAWPEQRVAVALLCNINRAPLGRTDVERLAGYFLEAAAEPAGLSR